MLVPELFIHCSLKSATSTPPLSLICKRCLRVRQYSSLLLSTSPILRSSSRAAGQSGNQRARRRSQHLDPKLSKDLPLAVAPSPCSIPSERTGPAPTSHAIQTLTTAPHACKTSYNPGANSTLQDSAIEIPGLCSAARGNQQQSLVHQGSIHGGNGQQMVDQQRSTPAFFASAHSL